MSAGRCSAFCRRAWNGRRDGIVLEKNKLVQGEAIKAYGSYELRYKFGYGIEGTVHVLVVEQ